MTPDPTTPLKTDMHPQPPVAVPRTAYPVTPTRTPTHTAPGQDWAGVAHRVLDGAGVAWSGLWKCVKLGICIALDILDFFIGRILGFGIAFDVGCALITSALWGKRGMWALWEVIDITEQIDGFVPTCTIIALRAWND